MLCDIEDPKAPKHLHVFVGKEPQTATCRWKASGPGDLSEAKVLQKRLCYCLPRNGAYDKCAIQWTEVSSFRQWHASTAFHFPLIVLRLVYYLKVVDGKEDLRYRLFHVFPNPSANTSATKTRLRIRPFENEEECCELCGKEDKLDSLMECSNCECRYCHTFCLGLTELPKGDWFCSKFTQQTLLAVVAAMNSHSSPTCSFLAHFVVTLVMLELCMPRKPSMTVRDSRKRTTQERIVSLQPKEQKSHSPNDSTTSRGKEPHVIATIPGNYAVSSSLGSGNRKRREHLHRRLVSPLESDMKKEEPLHADEYGLGRAAIVSHETAKCEAAVHYKLTRFQMVPTLKDHAVNLDDHLGFLIMNSYNATFADVRAAIQDEVDPDALHGKAWKFAMPSLGPISRKQEELLGPVTNFMEKAFSNRLGDGSAVNPIVLCLSLTK